MTKKTTSQQKKTKLKKQADGLLQEWGRRTYSKCIACGSPMSCLHHFHTKGSSYALRYDRDNVFPTCASCHFSHHKINDPKLHGAIMCKMGVEWYKKLERRKGTETVRDTIEYIEKIIEELYDISNT